MQIDRSLVQGFDLLEGLQPTEIDEMLALATSRRYPLGEIVFEQGSDAAHFFLLLHGRFLARFSIDARFGYGRQYCVGIFLLLQHRFQ